MNSRARIAVGAVAVLLAIGPAIRAQIALQPTPRPIVTADNEPWYRSGVPIVHAGVTFFPAGPIVHFNAHEMVRSGHFEGVPIYTRTTIEPYSFVFVPLAGGLMHPYERRRAGDVAGTVGSVTPSFPVIRAGEQSNMEYVPGAGMIQAQAPPSQVGEIVDRIGLAESAAPPAVEPVATIGLPAAPLGPNATALRPEGLNGVFIEYRSRRYFSSGRAIAFDEKIFSRVGDYHGFPVYRKQGEDETVYIPARGGVPGLVAPYRPR